VEWSVEEKKKTDALGGKEVQKGEWAVRHKKVGPSRRKKEV